MARKTVKVTVPIKQPDKFSKLLEKIQERHVALGANSPLDGNPKIDMLDFDTKRLAGDKKRSDSEEFRGKAEDAMQEAKVIYGSAEGQSIETPGTLYKMVDTIKDILLLEHNGNEEELSTYGFDVVVGTAKSPQKQPA
jgi:hypothetical protein